MRDVCSVQCHAICFCHDHISVVDTCWKLFSRFPMKLSIPQKTILKCHHGGHGLVVIMFAPLHDYSHINYITLNNNPLPLKECHLDIHSLNL